MSKGQTNLAIGLLVFIAVGVGTLVALQLRGNLVSRMFRAWQQERTVMREDAEQVRLTSLQGTIQAFQDALARGDAVGMNTLCDMRLFTACNSIVRRLSDVGPVGTVGSVGFDHPADRHRLDGTVFAWGPGGSELLSIAITVEQTGDGAPWIITAIR